MRVGEKEISEQAEIVRRYADLFSREQLDALREAEESATGTSASCSTGCGRPAKAVSSPPSSPSVRTSSRTGSSPTRVTFRGEEMPLRNAQAQLAVLPAYADREELGEIQAAASAQFNADRLELLRAGEELSADYSGIADPVERNEEEKAISLHELSRALKQASDAGDRELRPPARTLVRSTARRRARRDPVELPHGVHAPALAARVDLHEGSRDRDLPADAGGARLRPERAAEHQARSRRSPAEVAAGLRDRERPADRRPPDHARAGRAARLPGVPARGGARAALRGLRPACRTPSAASRATTR